jgi:hypothetical protein
MQGKMFAIFARLTPWQDHGEYARYPFNESSLQYATGYLTALPSGTYLPIDRGRRQAG